MKKYSKIFKAICLAISALFILSSVPFSASAADQSSLGVADLTPEAFHSIVSQSENKLPDEIYANLSLCEEDLPEAMTGSGIEETEAVVRLKGQEKELSSLLYANADGTYTEYFFSENVKYGKDGTVKDKSNKLTYSENLGGFTNEENDINVILPTVYTSENGVSLSYGENVISFAVDDCASSEAEYIKGENGADKIVYKDVFAPGIDLEYHAQFSGVKENIILNEKPQNNVFTFKIKTNGAYLQNENGTVLILDEKGEGIGYIGELYIYDAEGKTGSGEVQLEEIKAGDEYLYILTVDNEYLNSADTVYPVTVDPRVIYKTNSTISDSSLIKSGSTYTLNTSASYAMLGYYISTSTGRLLMKFPAAVSRINSFGSTETLISASLKLYTTSTINTNMTIQCYCMTSDWNQTLNGSASSYLWNAVSAGSVKTASFTSSVKTVTFDIKDYFDAWCSPMFCDFGLMIKYSGDNTQGNYCNIVCTENDESGVTSKRPNLTITFSVADLPTGADQTIKPKSLYTVKHISSSYYAACAHSNNNYSAVLSSGSPAPGSTLGLSRFFSIENVSGTPYYTLSPTNGNYRGSPELWTGTTSFYMKAGSSSITYTSTLSDACKWYLIKVGNSGSVYYIVNKEYPEKCLNVSTVSVYLFNDQTDLQTLTWQLDFVGLDVPLQKQDDGNWCGPASISMILSYYGINISQSTIKSVMSNVNWDYTNIADLTSYINGKLSGVSYTNSARTAYNENQFWEIIKVNIDNEHPIMLNIGNTSDNQTPLPYVSPSHYIVIKGYLTINSVKYILIDDCCAFYHNNQCTGSYHGEYLYQYHDIHECRSKADAHGRSMIVELTYGG